MNLFYGCMVAIILALSVFNIAFYSSKESGRVLGLKIVVDSNQVLLQEQYFWNNLLKENPTYLQGWVELAKINIQLEDIDSAREALFKARKVDPNSILLEELEKNLMLKG
ncbi:MAG: hypothetical protein ACC618_01165 [Patescibacteria group bacterium]